MKKKRAYAYTRSATGETSHIQLQTICVSEYCRSKNLRLVDIFTDSHKSGSNIFQNNSFDEMLSKCRKKDKIDEIVVTDWDRLSRNTYDLYLITELLSKKGIKLVALNDLDDNYKELMISIYKHKNP